MQAKNKHPRARLLKFQPEVTIMIKEEMNFIRSSWRIAKHLVPTKNWNDETYRKKEKLNKNRQYPNQYLLKIWTLHKHQQSLPHPHNKVPTGLMYKNLFSMLQPLTPRIHVKTKRIFRRMG